MAEEARLESVYTSKAYPGFESPSLRKEVKRGFKAIKAESLCESPSLRRRKTGVQSHLGRKPMRIPVSPQEINDKPIPNENNFK